ncbi:MFS transporter [Marinivivus vitaminiproducens]|uniref:MFS transporter n=1 Tax=Marinivivus vitaminiproducens TaxID=3035935 RepID=UPI00279B947E|nr:MFS transporter [Geminicoccaceae bacterium SCSIO 64248]
MSAILPAVLALVVGISTVQLANGFLGTLIGVRVGTGIFPAVLNGVILSAYYAGYTLGAATVGDVIQRIGHIRAFAALAGLVGAAVVLQAVLVDPWFWIAARIATGFGCAGLFIATESWLNAKSTADTRGSVFALYMVATYATYGGGQFVLNAADPAGFELFALAAALFSLALVPVSMTHAAAPVLPPSPRLRMSELRRVAPVALAGCAASGLASSAFYALVPVFAQGAGYSVSAIATFMATAIAGGLAFQIPVGRLSDRLDRRVLACGLALGLAAAAALMMLHDTETGWPAYLNAFVLGGFFSTIYPVCVAHANDRVAPERVVAVSGQLILISGIASCLGPIAGSWLMNMAGIGAVFGFMAAVALLFAATGLWRIVSTEPPERQPRLFTFLSGHMSHQIAHVADPPAPDHPATAPVPPPVAGPAPRA